MRKILLVLSEWGYWGEELIGPLEVFDEKGYESTFCTPTGRRPRALPPSMSSDFVDPPLGRSVTSAEMAEKVRAIDNPNNQRLDNPIDLSAWFPQRPYWSGADDNGAIDKDRPVLRLWEEYYRKRSAAQEDANRFDAIVLVGGSGPMIDMVNNYRVHDLILGFLDHGKPIAAECYGVGCLAQARDYSIRKSIIWGKHVTGHAVEYDYRNNTGVLNPGTGEVLNNQNNQFVNFGPPFYSRAIKTAATPPMGSVFLALPMDVLDQPNAEPIARSFPVRSIVVPDEATIAEAARLMRGAARPLILMGDGIAAAGAQAELTEVADLVGAVVWGGNCSEVNMRASHPLFGGYLDHMFGDDSKAVISKADVVLICGTTVLPEVFPSLEGVFAENAKVIHFDLNTTEVAKNFALTIGALAEPKATLARLAAILRKTMTAAESERAGERRKRHDAEKGARRRAELERDALARDRVPMRPARFMADLAERLAALARPALIFDEALTSAPDLLRYLPQEEPGTWFQTRVGMLGTGLPGTVGLKLAHPDRTVFGFAGDGSAISTIQALATAARYRIGAKFIVCNNRSYRILKLNLQQYYWRDLHEPPNQSFPDSFDLAQPELRFGRLAQGQGIDAVRVERPDEIASALDRALVDDKPFLIDLVLSSDV